VSDEYPIVGEVKLFPHSLVLVYPEQYLSTNLFEITRIFKTYREFVYSFGSLEMVIKENPLLIMHVDEKDKTRDLRNLALSLSDESGKYF
jgi:hypothetical protein